MNDRPDVPTVRIEIALEDPTPVVKINRRQLGEDWRRFEIWFERRPELRALVERACEIRDGRRAA